MNDKVRVRRGVNGVGWVMTINPESTSNWLWFDTWDEAISAANWWAGSRGLGRRERKADRRRWAGA